MENKSTDAEYAAKIKALAAQRDQEVSHILADDLLCALLTELGYEETVKEFQQLAKWYA